MMEKIIAYVVTAVFAGGFLAGVAGFLWIVIKSWRAGDTPPMPPGPSAEDQPGH